MSARNEQFLLHLTQYTYKYYAQSDTVSLSDRNRHFRGIRSAPGWDIVDRSCLRRRMYGAQTGSTNAGSIPPQEHTNAFTCDSRDEV